MPAVKSQSRKPAPKKPGLPISAGAESKRKHLPSISMKSLGISKLFKKNKSEKTRLSSHILDGFILKDKEGRPIPSPTFEATANYKLRDMRNTPTALDKVLMPKNATCVCCAKVERDNDLVRKKTLNV